MKKFMISERPNLFEPNVYISMIIKLSGELSVDQVKDAVSNAYQSNESTMSRISLKLTGEAYYEKLETSGCKVFVDKRNWKEILNESEKVPFEICNGELVRTYIIPEEAQTTVLIMAHHLVGDGKSILILVEDIVRCLDGETIAYKALDTVEKSLLYTKVRIPLLLRLGLTFINKSWKRQGLVFGWRDYYNIHERYWKTNHIDIDVVSYNNSELEDMKRDSRNLEITLNSYLVAKLQHEYPEYKVIGIPVSIRGDNKSMSNQTSGIKIVHKQIKGKWDLSVNAKKIHKKIYHKLRFDGTKFFVLSFVSEVAPSLIDAVLLQTHNCYHHFWARIMSYIMGYQGSSKTDLGITNLGNIDIPNEYTNFNISEILFIPPKVSYANIVIGISTFDGKLSICTSK